MTRKNTHTGKSSASREAYSRYIKKLDYEPTVETPAPFLSTTEGGEELKNPSSTRKRKKTLSSKIQDHISENWIGWLLGLAIIVLFFLMIDSKVDLARINTNLEYLKENVGSIRNDIKEQDRKNQSQDLLINGNSIKITNLEKVK